MNGAVNALAIFDDGAGPALYAAGSFTMAGGSTANRIAKWNGTAWAALGSGLSYVASALAVYDDGAGPALYVAGPFSSAGGINAHGIAKWRNGQWSAAGAIDPTLIGALTVYDDGGGPALYAAGRYISLPSGIQRPIARLQNGTWSEVGTLVGQIFALRVLDDGSGAKLYASGDRLYEGSANDSRRNVMRWDGSNWTPAGGEVNGTMYALCEFDSGAGAELIAGGGYVTWAEGNPASGVARWNGFQWRSLWPGNGVSGSINKLEEFNNGTGPELFASGGFWLPGERYAYPLARWNGQTLVGDATFEPEVAPFFRLLGTIGKGGLARLYAFSWNQIDPGELLTWDGTNWQTFAQVAGGSFTLVNAAVEFDDGGGPALFVAGQFTSIDGMPVKNIAKWNGSQWTELGGGIWDESFDGLKALAVFDDGSGLALYAGGMIYEAGSLHASGVARWDGTAWSSVGGWVDCYQDCDVKSMAVFDAGNGPALYVAGDFSNAGGVPAQGFAKWDGSQWSAPPEELAHDGAVLTLKVIDDGVRPLLYAGGNFSEIGGVPTRGIARWDGVRWDSPGRGMNTDLGSIPQVRSILTVHRGMEPVLCVGGSFRQVDDLVAGNLIIAAFQPLSGDCDGDGDTDLVDQSIAQNCFESSEALPSNCQCAELTGDLNIDLDDYTASEDCVTGPRP